MKAVKARFENGQVTLSELPPATTPADVIVFFPEPADDPWEHILMDPNPCAALEQWVKDVDEDNRRKKSSTAE